MNGYVKLILSIVIFIAVLLLTHYTTKYIAKLQKIGMRGENISIIESQRLSNTKNLYIVKIGQEYYALATGKDTVSVIGKLDSQGLILPQENPDTEKTETGITNSFSNVLEKIRRKQDKE